MSDTLTWLADELDTLLAMVAQLTTSADGRAILSQQVPAGAGAAVMDALDSGGRVFAAISAVVAGLRDIGVSGAHRSMPDTVRKLAESTTVMLSSLEEVVSSLRQIVADPDGAIGQLVSAVIGLWLEVYHPVLIRILDLLTLAEPAGEGATRAWSVLQLERLPDLLEAPSALIGAEYLPSEGRVEAVATRLAPRTLSLLHALGVHVSPGLGGSGASIATIPTDNLVEALLVWQPDALGSPTAQARVGLALREDALRGLQLVIVPGGTVEISRWYGNWLLGLTTSGELPVTIDGAGVVSLDEDAGLDVKLSLGYEGSQVLEDGDSEPVNTGVSVGSVKLGMQARVEADALVPSLGFRLEDLVLQVAAGDGDSFLSSVLPDLQARADLTISWSRSHGLQFEGGLGLDVMIPLGVDLLVAHLESLSLHVGVGEAGADVSLWAALDASLNLAVARLSVEGVGVRCALRFGDGGNLGPVNLALGFKPPTGLGLSIGTDTVGGGGFLNFDEERGQYSGMLALQLAGLCDVTAIALLDTKLPDGTEGWSFLGLLFAEFNPGLQLGLGFTLLGVGGMFGFNKEIDTDALLGLYQAGRIDGLMFPEDPIAQAPQLIADLRGVFPTASGRVVFGPFVSFGFGTPTVVEAELGVLVSLPSPVVVVLLGELSIYLPAREAPLAELHIDVLGFLDLGRKVFFLGGQLRDSRVLTYTLSGGMAFWLTWGEQSDFAFSIGGFHPAFTPPPALPVPPRLTCSMGLGDVARLEQQQYLALTPNTFQIGARIELNARLCGFSVCAWAGYDALLYFKPFRFLADFTAGVEVRRGGRTLASMDVVGHLSGPNPFRLWGKIRVSLFFFDIKIPIDLSFGDRRDEPVSTRTPLAALCASLEDPACWSTEAGDGGVALELPRAEDEAPILDPSGRLRFLQREIPLERPISRFEQADLDAAVTLSVRLEGSAAELLDVPLAPGSWQQLSDAQRLSLPRPFEPTPAGLRLTPSGAAHGTPASLAIRRDQSVTDAPDGLDAPDEMQGFSQANRAKRAVPKVRRAGAPISSDWFTQGAP